MKRIILELYGFEKRMEVSDHIYYSGHINIAIQRPLKLITKDDFNKTSSYTDLSDNVIEFYKEDDDVWRPTP